jgi:hypothetical protein
LPEMREGASEFRQKLADATGRFEKRTGESRQWILAERKRKEVIWKKMDREFVQCRVDRSNIESKSRKDALEVKAKDARGAYNVMAGLADRIAQSDKEIRFAQANDRALFLMLGERIEQEKAKDANAIPWGGGLGLGSLETLLEELVDMKLEVGGKLVVAKLNIRRQGEYRRVLKDRRLVDLLSYYEGSEVQYDVILKELDTYDRLREGFFKMIIGFEEAVCKGLNGGVAPLKDGHPDHQFVLNLIKADAGIVKSEDQKRILKNQLAILRNKVFHNQIPHSTNMRYNEALMKDWIGDMMKSGNYGLVCGAYFAFVEGEYRKIRDLVVIV